MELLGGLFRDRGDGNVNLSDALAQLAAKEKYLALEEYGRRFNVGVKYGLLMAQFALALNGEDREKVLSRLLEVMAWREQDTPVE
jgi:UTP--glucose-1-phosphate uridylyltransferase